MRGLSSVLRSFRDAAVEHIKANVPHFRDVGPSGGILSEQALKRYAMLAPSCRVAMLGMSNVERQSSGMLRGPAHCIAYIVAEDEPPVESWDVALMLAEKVIDALEGVHTGYPGAGIAQVKEFQNMFSLDGEVKGLSLMGVAWDQDLEFGPNFHDSTMKDWSDQLGLGALNEAALKRRILDAFGPQPVDVLLNSRFGRQRDE
jgi:hypothetical protein